MPADVVVRRFAAGWRNFERVYKPLVNAWALYDNSGDAPVLIDAEEKPSSRSGSHPSTEISWEHSRLLSARPPWPAGSRSKPARPSTSSRTAASLTGTRPGRDADPRGPARTDEAASTAGHDDGVTH